MSNDEEEVIMNKLRLGTPRNIAEFMIIPVERINISAQKMKKVGWLYGSKEIATLVIYTACKLWAFDIDGQELSVEKLSCEVSDLKGFFADYEK